jgi:microcystin-dependent protein
MSSPELYIGEIRLFAGGFAPIGWALCNGQLLSISNNDALYSLLGTTYGGDGMNTFALPDLRGRIPIHYGQGRGLSKRTLGEMGGTPLVTLTETEMPMHTHTFYATTEVADANTPANNLVAQPPVVSLYRESDPSGDPMAGTAISQAPGNAYPHENTQPFLCVTFIIALEGIYPPRS